jgi:hypothetical protein
LLAWLLVSSNSKIIYIFYTKNAQKSATKKPSALILSAALPLMVQQAWVMTVFSCSVLFLFRLATPAPFCCNLRPLRGFRSPLAHTLASFFVCRFWLPLGGGAYREAVGGKVFNRSHAQTQIALAILFGRGGAAALQR